MQILINGERRETAAVTVAGLIAELELDTRYAALEKNGAIVPKATYGQAPLADGDRLELLTFIGGG